MDAKQLEALDLVIQAAKEKGAAEQRLNQESPELNWGEDGDKSGFGAASIALERAIAKAQEVFN